MNTFMRVAAALLWVASLASSTGLAHAQGSAAQLTERMQPIQLTRGDAATQDLWQLWADLLISDEKAWAKVAANFNNRALPAWLLVADFTVGETRIRVTSLNTIYDCELPPGGKNSSQLYSRCPIRVLISAPGSESQVLRFGQDVCYLWVTPPTKTTPGPEPAHNFVTAILNPTTGSLNLRTTQHNQRVSGCDANFSLREKI